MATDTKERLTAIEAAEYIGMSAAQLARYRTTGEGPPFLKINRKVLYPVSAIDAWLATKQVTQTNGAVRERNRRRKSEARERVEA